MKRMRKAWLVPTLIVLTILTALGGVCVVNAKENTSSADQQDRKSVV